MEQNEYLEIKDLLHKQDIKLTRIEERLIDYPTVRDKSNMALETSTQNKEDIKEIQDKIKFLSRTITAALITGAIGIVFLFIKVGMGVK